MAISDINECHDAFKCSNGGKCINSLGSFGCDCTDTGYIGRYCDEDIDECSENSLNLENDRSDSCLNGGTCENTPGNFTCSCEGTGYNGWLCESDINECLSYVGICQNNGTCLNTNGSYTCNCHETGFTGYKCELGE